MNLKIDKMNENVNLMSVGIASLEDKDTVIKMKSVKEENEEQRK